MQNTWMRLWSLAAGVAGLLVFAWAVLAYARIPAIVAAIVTLPLLSLAWGRRWLAGSVLLLFFGAAIWAAFGTTVGYFWLNRTRLEALVAAIEAVPAISSLELGNDDPLPRALGRTGRYDSYRFINGRLVTRYQEQVAPTAFQPVLRETDVLRELGVSPAQYGALREALGRLLLAGFDRRQGGEVALNEVMPGGTPWVTSFLHRPAEGPPSAGNGQVLRQLAPRWFRIWRGWAPRWLRWRKRRWRRTPQES